MITAMDQIWMGCIVAAMVILAIYSLYWTKKRK